MRGPLRSKERAIIFALLVLFVSGVVFTMWHLTRLQSRLNESSALEHAKLYAEAITEFRTLYTQEVVETVRNQGIMVTHDYRDHQGAIPLPATLSMLLGMRIGKQGSGAQTRLYSAYPFPWRKEENQRLVQDPFARDAWNIGRRTQIQMSLFTALKNWKVVCRCDMPWRIGCVLLVSTVTTATPKRPRMTGRSMTFVESLRSLLPWIRSSNTPRPD